MTRSQNSSTYGLKKASTKSSRTALIMGTALASIALTGCASTAPRADASVSKAQIALDKGKVSKAIALAEEAVFADPRNAAHRSLLGAAYLEAGRFQSAATSFEDAMKLGDDSARTVLSYALAKVATGDNASALSKLQANQQAINPADYGLAVALAGKPENGTHVLVNALRAGQNSAKMRQNLAYAYALAGNWRAARVMAAEDVPADQLDARLSKWAAMASPEAYTARVADLLQVTAQSDAGQPQRLALANFPSTQQMVAEAAATSPAPVAQPARPAIAAAKPAKVETVAVKPAAPKPAPAPAVAPAPKKIEKVDPSVAQIFAATGQTPAKKPAVAAPKPVAKQTRVTASPSGTSGSRFVSNPVVQKLPVAAARPAPKRVAKAPVAAPKPAPQRRVASSAPKADTHLVQLGSYSSRTEAERGWKVIKSKFPQLASHDVVITQAEVKGKTYFRVAAAGFGQSSARSMCRTVKASGRGCFAYAAANPPAGAVDRGVRIAARSR
ncbi:MAG: SPOR domain-containing protein [Pseudomonadota bacterium]